MSVLCKAVEVDLLASCQGPAQVNAGVCKGCTGNERALVGQRLIDFWSAAIGASKSSGMSPLKQSLDPSEMEAFNAGHHGTISTGMLRADVSLRCITCQQKSLDL